MQTRTKSDPLLGSGWVQSTLWGEGIMVSVGESRHIADMVIRLLPQLYGAVCMGDSRVSLYFEGGKLRDISGPQHWILREGV